MRDILPDLENGTEGYLADYFRRLKELITTLDTRTLSQIADAFWTCWRDDRRLVFCGNGGSSTTCSHMVCDFQKNITLVGGKPFEVISLTDSPALLLAWGNDLSFEQVFAAQARVWLRKDDVLVAISASGNSPNVLAAVRAAREAGAIVVGLSGYAGGQLASACDYALIAPIANMQLIEDIHLAVCHSLFSVLRDRVRGLLE